MIAALLCGGPIVNYKYMKSYIKKAEFIVCADGGAKHLLRLGVRADMLVGDLDSISRSDLAMILCGNVEIVKLDREKNDTDSEHAIDILCERGYEKVYLLAALGMRMDHTLANIHLLKKMLEQGIQGIIADEYNEIFLVKDTIDIVRADHMKSKVSLIPLTGKVSGICTQGLYYPLENEMLSIGSTRGISNEFSADTAKVSIKEGLLLVMLTSD